MFPRPLSFSAAIAWAILAVRVQAFQGHTIRDCALEPVTGPFYLTGVPANGSATYPIFTATESRGVQTLSSAISYFDQWTYNTTDNRIYIAGTNIGNAAQQTGTAVIFGTGWSDFGFPYGEDGLFSLVTGENCDTYLTVTGADSVYGWWGEPTSNDGLPISMTWYGGEGGANAATQFNVAVGWSDGNFSQSSGHLDEFSGDLDEEYSAGEFDDAIMKLLIDDNKLLRSKFKKLRASVEELEDMIQAEEA